MEKAFLDYKQNPKQNILKPNLLAPVAPHRNGFPLLVHMTFKDKGAFLRHHMLSLASWTKTNPDYMILMYDDNDLTNYMQYNTTVLQLYNKLKTPVEKADLWRYVVMCRHGGVYTDADTLCVRPVQVSRV
jgi:mannosyltransferase OCH1-like enzyme